MDHTQTCPYGAFIETTARYLGLDDYAVAGENGTSRRIDAAAQQHSARADSPGEIV